MSRRPHDSAASRAALLEAARAVFRERGYERATTREIGERAGVDPALIARYFGSKERLYVAAVAELSPADTDFDFEPVALLAGLLERWEERGHNPISRALASPALGDDVRREVVAVIGDLLLAPEAALLRERGASAPELRAELLVAIAVGVAATRANGSLERLAAASREELIAVLEPALERLAGG